MNWLRFIYNSEFLAKSKKKKTELDQNLSKLEKNIYIIQWGAISGEGVQRGSDSITTFKIMKWRPPSHKKQFFRKNLSVISLKYTQHMIKPSTTTHPVPKYYIIFERPDAINLRSNIPSNL